MMRRSLDFSKINAAALIALPAICGRWMPRGKRVGREYVALNPTQAAAALERVVRSIVNGCRERNWCIVCGGPVCANDYLANVPPVTAAERRNAEEHRRELDRRVSAILAGRARS